MRLQIVVSSLLCAALGLPALAADSCKVRSGERIVPLVELYTSEGCSSCPPADRWLSAKLAETSLNWLAFHVDYWDYIGWTDRFADPRYSARQRQRANAAGASTVYTPQVMVGADVRVAWQSAGAFDHAVEAGAGVAPIDLGLSLDGGPDGIEVSLTALDRNLAGAAAEVWLARYVDGQQSRVKAGENSGVTLHHDRVVTRLWGPWRLEDSGLTQSMRLATDPSDWGLVAFVQDSRGRTLQSLGVSWKACETRAGIASP
jgi:hypothetical protein